MGEIECWDIGFRTVRGMKICFPEPLLSPRTLLNAFAYALPIPRAYIDRILFDEYGGQMFQEFSLGQIVFNVFFRNVSDVLTFFMSYLLLDDWGSIRV